MTNHLAALSTMILFFGCAVRPPAEIQAAADLSRQALDAVSDQGALPGDKAVLAAADAADSTARYLGAPPPDRALAYRPGESPTLAEPGSLSKAEADALAAEIASKASALADAEAKRRALEARLTRIMADPVGELGLVLEGSGLPPWLQALLGTALTVGAGYFGLSAKRRGTQAQGLLGVLVANGGDALRHVAGLAARLAPGPDATGEHERQVTAAVEALKRDFTTNNREFEPLIRKALGKDGGK